jgi:HPt (histidine-containing phosphotransfer) domain-containing protein
VKALIIVHVDGALQELVPGYLANRHRDVARIRAAAAQLDYATIRFLGHSMRGSGTGYGFAAITQIGESIEQAASGEDAEAVEQCVTTLLSYLVRVQVVYRP